MFFCDAIRRLPTTAFSISCLDLADINAFCLNDLEASLLHL